MLGNGRDGRAFLLPFASRLPEKNPDPKYCFPHHKIMCCSPNFSTSFSITRNDLFATLISGCYILHGRILKRPDCLAGYPASRLTTSASLILGKPSAFCRYGWGRILSGGIKNKIRIKAKKFVTSTVFNVSKHRI